MGKPRENMYVLIILILIVFGALLASNVIPLSVVLGRTAPEISDVRIGWIAEEIYGGWVWVKSINMSLVFTGSKTHLIILHNSPDEYKLIAKLEEPGIYNITYDYIPVPAPAYAGYPKILILEGEYLFDAILDGEINLLKLINKYGLIQEYNVVSGFEPITSLFSFKILVFDMTTGLKISARYKLYEDDTLIDESTIPVDGKQFNIILGEHTYRLVVYKPGWLTGPGVENVNIIITKDTVTFKYDDKHVFEYNIHEVDEEAFWITMYKSPTSPPKINIYINNMHVGTEAPITIDPGSISLKIVVNDNAYIYKISYTIYRDGEIYDTGTADIYRLSQISDPVTVEFTTRELESGSYTLKVMVDSNVDITHDIRLNVVVKPEIHQPILLQPEEINIVDHETNTTYKVTIKPTINIYILIAVSVIAVMAIIYYHKRKTI